MISDFTSVTEAEFFFSSTPLNSCLFAWTTCDKTNFVSNSKSLEMIPMSLRCEVMYNPSRGGVRGGADQFTWESVKTDKHRENYLGHSLKAPVGRWQKGKDLAWYAKGRKDDEEAQKAEKAEMAAVKQAEEEAMLIALGQKPAKREFQAHSLTKEEMTEALKRNIGDKDELNIERVDGVGATSRRAALLTGISKDSRTKNEGVVFVTQKERDVSDRHAKDSSPSSKRPKSKKKSKKEKKHKRSQTSSESEKETDTKRKHKKHKKETELDLHSVSKLKHKKKSKHRHHSSSDSENKNNHKKNRDKSYEKYRTHQRRRHDTSDSN